ncbi:ANTAR domain-containing response regulator [Pararhodobacter aggregans]|uniref:ANTAR domain-containing protein n=1 Tax=Pararhodobacter aggregans TaxID=404875 RepID=A0A2T7USN1_9RHOB|nr:ANTAR domain-containing protein [Pararhodobacter aggregans]PTX03465.1 AmiR/NasT family two-component response regulator [Pararhodobacter aggregans]PVE47755.1 ANTAR domain-containing protein [Pararhodobacter aggregans]
MKSDGRDKRALETPKLLRELRALRVAVFHPQDSDGEQLTQQLQRIGCQVQAFWPPLPEPPADTNVVFLAVRPDVIKLEFPWSKAENAPTIIAVVNYENPVIVDALLRLGAKSVIASPVRSFGLLSALVVARHVSEQARTKDRQIARLEGKLFGIRKVSEAKSILMETRGISDKEAYQVIREQAMSKRVSTEEIANAIINANSILSFKR